MTFDIYLGAMAPKIGEQLTDAGVAPLAGRADRSLASEQERAVALWQRLADAATLLHLHRIASDAETDKMRARLVKDIARSCVPIAPAPGDAEGEG